jgi:hypothetical protein
VYNFTVRELFQYVDPSRRRRLLRLTKECFLSFLNTSSSGFLQLPAIILDHMPAGDLLDNHGFTVEDLKALQEAMDHVGLSLNYRSIPKKLCPWLDRRKARRQMIRRKRGALN